jgi:hypothetical protein
MIKFHRPCLATVFIFVFYFFQKNQPLFKASTKQLSLFFSHKKFKSYFTLYYINHFLLLFKQKTHNKTLYQTYP